MTLTAASSNVARVSLTIEPVNLCNLACSYCLRDDAHLHRDPAEYLSPDLLRRVLREAAQTCGADEVSFSGGEPTLHPRFGELVDVVAGEGYRFSFVTNGWHFGRVRDSLVRHKSALRLVAFSLDGASESTHDNIRGKGSFRRLMSAVADCHALGLPFRFKAVLHRHNAQRVETLALFAARVGALGIKFAHLLPTTPAIEASLGLSEQERLAVESEIGVMRRVLRIEVLLAAGFTNTDPAPPCRVLAGKECNIDYAGRMSICCNLSGFGGGVPDRDIVADLNVTSFGEAWRRVYELVSIQNTRRQAALETAAKRASFRVTSPCELCLTHFNKTPWPRPSETITETGR